MIYTLYCILYVTNEDINSYYMLVLVIWYFWMTWHASNTHLVMEHNFSTIYTNIQSIHGACESASMGSSYSAFIHHISPQQHVTQDRSIWVTSERQVRWWDELTGFIIIICMHDHGINGTHAKVENNELCMSCICNYCMYYITRQYCMLSIK